MSNLIRHIFLLIVLTGLASNAESQEYLSMPALPQALVINRLEENYRMEERLEVRLDQQGTLKLQTILTDTGSPFRPYSGNEIIPAEGAYWGRIYLENQLADSIAPAEWVLSFSSLFTEVEVFLFDSTRIQSRQTGTFLPISSRDFAPNNDQNLVKIILPPGQSRLLYFRVSSEIQQVVPFRAPELQSLEAHFKKQSNQQQGSGFFIGFMVMILVYSLSQYFFQQDKAYLYYSGYVLTLIVWWSFNRGILLEPPFSGLFDQHPQYVNFFKLVTYLGLFSYLAFIQAFLELHTLLPWWNRFFKIMIWVGIPLLFIDALLLWSTNFSLSRADQLAVFYILSFVVLTYIFLWPLYKTRDNKGVFIILGMLAMGSGFLLTAIHRFSTAGFTLTYFQIGTCIEVTIFSLGLAYRSNMVRKERQQATFDLEKSKLQEQKQEAVSRHLRELDELKTRFYTNVTHEFRTPLTVIIGMAEQLAEQFAAAREQEKNAQGLRLIHRNSKQLLRLVNQLLDLSKLESGHLKIEMIQGDMVAYLQYLTESFYSMAEEKGVRLVFYSEEEELIMDFDENKIQQIVFNLLSNAIKFTPKMGKVVFHILKTEENGQTFLQMKVKDSGIGIAPDQLPHIFDRFFQGDNSSTRPGDGTGIGLALTKELVDLLEGTIQVESSPDKGSTFQIHLPVRRSNPLKAFSLLPAKDQPAERSAAAVLPHSSPEMPVEPTADPEHPLLLIIEDNPDVVTYIQTLLEKDYTIQVAENGQIGIDLALEIIPDIIISDVMMPERDGYEVCETLKADGRTSHIPIILLTARATQDDRLEGLQYGADAYLTKPFHKEELLIRLEKLVEIRQKLQTRFLNYTGTTDIIKTKEPATPDPEELFLQKLTENVYLQLEDPDFGVSQLAEIMVMSQMQIYRKLKALTDKTPSQFIRSLRLQKGKELLLTTDLTISEIAYDIGFSDPNYFSRTFHKEFKNPPSFFRN